MWQLTCEIIYFSKERDEGLKGSQAVMAKIQHLKSQKFVIIIVFPRFLKMISQDQVKNKTIGNWISDLHGKLWHVKYMKATFRTL